MSRAGDQHAGRAVAALQGVLAREGLAQGGHHRVVAEALDGADRGAVATAGMGDAGARRRAVDLDVQAPHTPCSQPIWVPVSISRPRRRSARCSRGSTSTSVGLAVDRERDRNAAHDCFTAATACRSAVSAMARRQSSSSGYVATMRVGFGLGVRQQGGRVLDDERRPIERGKHGARRARPARSARRPWPWRTRRPCGRTSSVPSARPPAAPALRSRAAARRPRARSRRCR